MKRHQYLGGSEGAAGTAEGRGASGISGNPGIPGIPVATGSTDPTGSGERSAAIHCEDLTVRYGDVLALERASLTLAAGRICGVVGRNGAGKSTLFKAMLGLVRAEEGFVRLGGHHPASARKRGIVGYVPQNEEVDWDFPVSVREVVAMGRFGMLGPTRTLRSADKDAVDHAIERVGITSLAGRQIGALSGGQRKRVFVARGIAQGAHVLLLDEPFAGVDRTSEQTISALLRELANAGVAILVSTHDLHTLPELADEVLLLNRRVLLHDAPEVALQPENLARAFGLDTEPQTGDR